MSLGLYLHIPYCLARCRYCDFYSRGGQKEVPDAYVSALLRELERTCNCDCTALRPDTMYFGGGTPSLLRPDQAARLITAAAPVPEGEVTLEANPETVDPGKLEGFRKAKLSDFASSLNGAHCTRSGLVQINAAPVLGTWGQAALALLAEEICKNV